MSLYAGRGEKGLASNLFFPRTTSNSSFLVRGMMESEASVNVPMAPLLKSYGVPQEDVDEILKAGYEDALVWANAAKEDDLAKYFLRRGSPFRPSEAEADRQDSHEIVAVGFPTPTNLSGVEYLRAL